MSCGEQKKLFQRTRIVSQKRKRVGQNQEKTSFEALPWWGAKMGTSLPVYEAVLIG